jgi:uncharacterized coiled-coil protein SlyX
VDARERGAPAPRFSILLPTHNRADVLPFAILSVLGQTVQDYELLVVGDGCTDETAEVVARFEDPRVRWFDLPKAPGFGYANRNVALREARGGLIAFMAHDDIWLPDHLQLLEQHFADPAIELAYSRPLWVAPDGLITPTAFNLHERAMRESFLARQENHIPAACVVHRRECLARYGYWDEALPGGGDWDMWARIIAGGGEHNVAYESAPTCLHFRAIWKTEATAGVPEIPIWDELRRRGIVPATTPAVPVEPDRPEQATTWQALAADPPGWTRALRDAVYQALDCCVAQAYLFLAGEQKDHYPGSIGAQIFLKDQHIGNLEQIVAMQDRHVGNLERAIGLKDQHIANIEGALALKDQHIANLEASIAANQQGIALLNQTVEDKDRQIAQLERACADLEQALAGKDQQIADLGATLARQQQQADRRVADLEQAVADRERHINRIEGRLPVRLYRRIRRLVP